MRNQCEYLDCKSIDVRKYKESFDRSGRPFMCTLNSSLFRFTPKIVTAEELLLSSRYNERTFGCCQNYLKYLNPVLLAKRIAYTERTPTSQDLVQDPYQSMNNCYQRAIVWL